jgi:dipeptidyl aminopeptidase/acylaminoacyl peptidase
MMEPTVAPYGSWRSPIRIDDLLADTIRLAEPWVDGDDVYWIEGRPSEGGRSVLVRRGPDGIAVDLTGPSFDVRSRVHEYGGGSYVVAGGTIVFSNVMDGRLYRLDPGDPRPSPVTPEGQFRYGDLRFDPARRRFIGVREDHSGPGEPRAAIVDVPLDGDRQPIVMVSGPDFLAAPRLSPDGRWLAWLEWDHPDMPWEASRLRVAPVDDGGSLGPSDLAAGGLDESILQPEWSPDGTLHFISDRSGWWNLYRLVPGPRLEALAPMEAEFADPPWVLGTSSYAFLPEGSILAIARSGGRDRLLHVQPEQVGELVTPFTELGALRAGPGSIVALAGSPAESTVVASFDPTTLGPSGVLRRSSPGVIDQAYVSRPEPISFMSSDGRITHALYYALVNPEFSGPDGESPPLVVTCHGGPTSNSSTTLDLDTQLRTSRGIAVVDVDYAGSSGYGRAYREALEGGWGVVDVADCIAAARFLSERGDVDPARIAIEGASSGGLTVLAALASSDVFAAGIVLYGIGDLAALARDTHKFESRYLDRLVGVGGGVTAEARYEERSPIRHLDGISSPVLVLHGLDDRVVPPAQAEAIVTALADRGIQHAYVAFPGEGHGFRGTEAIRGTIEARLAFLGAIFGFTPADDLAPLEIGGREAAPDRAGVTA